MIKYVIVAVVMLSCSRRNKTVQGIVISPINATDSQSSKLILSFYFKLLQKIFIDLCAHARCPMIVCQNNLPALPSLGICCLRCISKYHIFLIYKFI